MSHRFKFQDQGEWYEVAGTYGNAPGEVFVVTKLIEGAKRMLGTQMGGPSGVKVEKAIAATSEGDLLAKLKQSYHAITEFQSF